MMVPVYTYTLDAALHPPPWPGHAVPDRVACYAGGWPWVWALYTPADAGETFDIMNALEVWSARYCPPRHRHSF